MFILMKSCNFFILNFPGLEKEKDSLHQLNKAEPASSKISEQRRKRIHELETEMNNLKKKLIEQQRMIKMNEKNEQKLKTLGKLLIKILYL